MILRCKKCGENLPYWHDSDTDKDSVLIVNICKCQDKTNTLKSIIERENSRMEEDKDRNNRNKTLAEALAEAIDLASQVMEDWRQRLIETEMKQAERADDDDDDDDDDDVQGCWYLDDDDVWQVGILYYWAIDYDDDDGQYPVGIIEPTDGPMVSIYAGSISLSPDKPESRPIEETIEETIAEITTRGSGHMRVYRLPKHPNKLDRSLIIAVQMEPTALIILSFAGYDVKTGQLVRAQVQGIAIWRDGEVECDAPDADIEALGDIFNASGCKAGRN